MSTASICGLDSAGAAGSASDLAATVSPALSVSAWSGRTQAAMAAQTPKIKTNRFINLECRPEDDNLPDDKPKLYLFWIKGFQHRKAQLSAYDPFD